MSKTIIPTLTAEQKEIVLSGASLPALIQPSSAKPTTRRNKYVIVQPEHCLPLAIILPEAILHKHALGPETKPVSTGFFSVDHGIVSVFGESTSLGLHSRPSDARIIQDTLYLMGLAL